MLKIDAKIGIRGYPAEVYMANREHVLRMYQAPVGE